MLIVLWEPVLIPIEGSTILSEGHRSTCTLDEIFLQ